MPRHLISDAHEWINEIPSVPTYWDACKLKGEIIRTFYEAKSTLANRIKKRGGITTEQLDVMSEAFTEVIALLEFSTLSDLTKKVEEMSEKVRQEAYRSEPAKTYASVARSSPPPPVGKGKNRLKPKKQHVALIYPEREDLPKDSEIRAAVIKGIINPSRD